MSDASVVKLLTLNTATVFNTSAAISRVKIHNDSSMYLRVYFGSDAPLDPTTQGWHDTIGPGGSPLIAVVGANVSVFSDRTDYIQSTPYLGVITVMPFLPVGAPVPAGGVITGASLCYLTGYFPYEEAEAGGQVEAFVQAAKQGRYQFAGPGSVAASLSTITFDQTTATGTFTSLDGIAATSTSPLLLANQAGNSVVNMYLFGWGGALRNNGPNVGGTDLKAQFAVTTSGGVLRQAVGVEVRRIARTVNFNCDNWWYAFPNPLLVQFTFAQGVLAFTDLIQYRYQKINSVGVYDGYITCAFLTDKVNQTPLTAFPPVPPPPGITSNQPWNGSYNPQTY